MNSNGTPTIWGIHAGKTGDAHSLFLKHGCIALGWNDIGDLSALAPNREAFKQAVSAAYPNYKRGAVPVAAGQLFRFANETESEDLVVYRAKQDGKIHLGRITGPYEYRPEIEPGYPTIAQ